MMPDAPTHAEKCNTSDIASACNQQYTKDTVLISQNDVLRYDLT